MALYAYIKDNTVVGIVEAGAEPSKAEGLTVVEAPDGTTILQTYLKGQFGPVPPADKGALAAYANAKQWGLATGGYTVTIGGQSLTFRTDAESYALITGKQVWLDKQATPPATISWQFGLTFVDIPTADFTAAAKAIEEFMQSTFDTLKDVFAGIEAGTITTFAEIDAAAWPANN